MSGPHGASVEALPFEGSGFEVVLVGEAGHFFAPEVLKELLEKRGFAVSVNRYGWRYTIHARLIRKEVQQ